MRFLIPWSTDRLSFQYTDPVVQVCLEPNPPGLQSSRDFGPSEQKNGFHQGK